MGNKARKKLRKKLIMNIHAGSFSLCFYGDTECNQIIILTFVFLNLNIIYIFIIIEQLLCPFITLMEKY